ncbi:hypothetical protein D052_1745 [Vibrio parahaemolyticus 10290]|nr:hypothetical protein D052_1745 [Vibrio parahaemolyticus 10290]
MSNRIGEHFIAGNESRDFIGHVIEAFVPMCQPIWRWPCLRVL